jgi:hypothetical protein
MAAGLTDKLMDMTEVARLHMARISHLSACGLRHGQITRSSKIKTQRRDDASHC